VRAFACISVRPADWAKTLTGRPAPQPHRHGAEEALLGQIGDIEPFSREHVALAKRIDIAPARGVESLVDVNVEHEIHIFQASVALPVKLCIYRALDDQQAIRLAQLERDPNRLREDDPFEWLEPHLVGKHHQLATAGQEPADVDPV